MSDTPRTKLGASGILVRFNRVLLGRREAKDASLPGLWCSPGGGVEYGETVDAAIVREFTEEVGLVVSVGKLISVEERITDHSHSAIVFKEVKVAGGQLTIGDGFDNVQWFTAAELMQMFEAGEVTKPTERALKAASSLFQ